jgi:fibronectin type 3 domain-containing protein
VVASHNVTLSWTGSSGTSGYNVYRSTASGTGYQKINSSLQTSTSYIDSAVLSGKTYYYVVTAVAAGGPESPYSNQTTVNIPNP